MARNKFNIDEELDVPFNWSQFKRSLVYIKKYKNKYCQNCTGKCAYYDIGF